MVVISPLEIGNNPKYNFTNDEFYILLSYQHSHQHQHDDDDEQSPLSITPSLNSILNAKKNGVISSLKLLNDENSSFSSLEESLSSSSNSSSSSLSITSSPSSYSSSLQQQQQQQQPSDFECSIMFPVNLNDHPLSIKDDDEQDDEQTEFCYCDETHNNSSNSTIPSSSTTTTLPPSSLLKMAKLKISKSFKKLSDLATSISQSTLRQQQQLLTISTMQFNARMTDDKFLSLSGCMETELDIIDINPEREEEEEEEEEKQENVMMMRQRESRINSRFLRIYAHDYSSKLKGELPYNDEDLDYYLNNYSNLSKLTKDTVKLSLLAREKLWSNVVLSPRNDEILTIANDKSRNFINLNATKSFWLQQQEQQQKVNAFGIIKVNNKQRYQYVRKGWVDSRWISSS